MLISQAYASPNHSARTEQISAIVLHHGAGTRQSDLSWLCNSVSKVSAHYYVCRDGTMYQLVDEALAAWHTGKATITNDQSIGVETEHTTLPSLPIQHTDWPQAQLNSLQWLIADIRKRYPIPLERVVSHRAIALPVGRKHDPAHPPLGPETDFRAWVATLDPAPAATSYTAFSPILAPPPATRARFTVPPSSTYKQVEIDSFIESYYSLCMRVNVDPVVAIAQMCHETGYLTSWWCERKRRNPAGIGVTGETKASATQPRGEWALHPDGLWHKGVSYRTWLLDAIPDHVGRLLGYALPAATGTTEQQALIQRANARRIIPIRVRGSAQTIKQLGRVHNPSGLGWADPGANYGARIAVIANRLIGAV